MAKRIQKLELDFAMNNINSYRFPSEFYDWIKQPFGVNRISALTSLTLKNIDINGETIEIILSNFPLLERLCLIHSWKLPQLKVSGAAGLNLKHLMIECHKMDILQVSSPNLLSLHVFEIFGNRLKLHVENIPKLVDVSVTYATYVSSSLSEYFSQFQILLLKFHSSENLSYKFSQFVASYKLKHLVLRANIYREAESLLGWTSLVEACPLLQKFTLDAVTSQPNYYRNTMREIKRVTKEHRHPCLKVVEIVGFTGIATEVELAIYFLENSSTLEQIIIDRRRTIHKGTPLEFDKHKPLEVQQKRALQLKRYLPPRVELLLI